MIDDPARGRYPMPSDCTGRDEVFVGRIRRDTSRDGGLTFWALTDSIRKGAATNVIDIIAEAARRGLIRR